MILVIALVAIAVWGLAATVVELRRDGYRRVPTDWNRVDSHADIGPERVRSRT